ncbi:MULTISPECIES: PDR/VanB family oxidoreductase [Microbacterium]|uniref:Oxidoreductase n=1 Tax=Microbacterium wangchenii TaxID=2541726 RepID=A0ABX5SSY0_9MICO|nr:MULTISPECIES: PDR/VanB family oxidoreductase [Microbacterium]MCK6066647.1 PDR/VanB family oxidoreductase [Microbacterium sp. EYE_512]QBR87979.1 oxidoreductase [Microbacterium wangchenii]TFV83898.1 oxidoreductase [Microbacterium sp. dk485]TXK18231.1 oxidoreductase [Microbacterium wangchenii]
MSYFSDVERDLVVAARTEIAAGVVALDLVAHNGRDLPAWTPGAHVDVILPSPAGAERVERQYSLCGDPADRSTWRIAVLREDAGRGGSVRLHEEVRVGERVRVRGPRSHFDFAITPGTRYRFVAGGIGITPIRAMAEAAAEAGAEWTLDYAGRGRETMAFVRELSERHPDRVRVHAADEGMRLDVAAVCAEADAATAVYVCGPARLIAAAEAAMPAERQAALHVERFEAKEFGPPVWPGPFQVELALSGETVTVAPGQSVLEAIEEQSPATMVLSSCRRGTCGTCEAPVLEGAVEHRDSVLTPLEQAEDTVMMVCVSRAACPALVLDL